MGKIVILDESTANKIAAGEVVERPASVVKELMENSIDAGATSISVDIKNGGVSYIKISDNGSGIAGDDVEIAFERHATSKIRSSNDLDSIVTLGFRGEALASIASVSEIELLTRTKDSETGTYIKITGGTVQEVKSAGCPVGTTFTVRDLFYNTPARFKFLKKDSTETGYISDIISKIALGKPSISIRFTSNGSRVIHTPGNGDLLSAIFSVFGKETAKMVIPAEYKDSRVKVTGFAGKPEIARASRTSQIFFLNGRYIKSKLISSAADEAYKTILMKNKYPFLVLNVEISPQMVDINVHPAKTEVRFSDEQEIWRSIY
ncbi:MAG TPA: DNA mismatch repair endonuclease MutL, partial [Clostridia bacterium]